MQLFRLSENQAKIAIFNLAQFLWIIDQIWL